MKSGSRINITRIFTKHFDTLYDYGKYKVSGKKVMPWSDRIIFFILPVVVSVLFFWAGVRITEGYINILITSLSIFVGLLFSLLALIFELGKKEKESKSALGENYKDGHKLDLIKELFINISFAIAISICSILFLLLTQFEPKVIIDYLKQFSCYEYIKTGYIAIITVLAITFVIEFVFVLLMILKRFFLLYLNQFEEPK